MPEPAYWAGIDPFRLADRRSRCFDPSLDRDQRLQIAVGQADQHRTTIGEHAEMTVTCTLIGLSLPVLEQKAVRHDRQAPTSLPDPEDHFGGAEVSLCATPALTGNAMCKCGPVL